MVLSFSVAVTIILKEAWKKITVYIVGVGKLLCEDVVSRLLSQFGKA